MNSIDIAERKHAEDALRLSNSLLEATHPNHHVGGILATAAQTPSSELNLKQLLTVLDAYRKGDFSTRMPNDLVSPLNEMLCVVGAVAKGDLSQNVPMEIDGLKPQGQFLVINSK